MTSCIRYDRNYFEAPLEEGTVRARRLLTTEQQREYDKLYLAGVTERLNGHTDAAHEFFTSALNINPNASEALYEEARLLLSLSPKSDSALVASGEEMLRKAVQLEPSNSHYTSLLADRWLRTGKYARAAHLYEKLVAQKPNTQDLSRLTRLYEVLGDYPKAIDALNQIENLEGADEGTALEKFRIYLEMGQTAQAYGTFEMLSEEHPDDLRYRVLLGDLYMQNGYKEKALDIYEDVLTSDPDNQLVRIGMLQYYLTENDTVQFNQKLSKILLDPKIENEQKRVLLQNYASESIRTGKMGSKATLLGHFHEALSLPQDDSSLGELCLAFVEAAKLPADSSHNALEAIVRDQPDHLQARLQLLSYYARHNNADAIVTLCHEGKQYHPEITVLHYYEGMALMQLDRQDECREVLSRATDYIDTESDPDMAADIYTILGDLYYKEGEKNKAYQAYENALHIKPDYVGCLNNYAYFLSLDRKDLDKALSMSKQAIEAEPQNPTYLDTYAWTLYCKRQYTQARIYIDQTLDCLADDETESASSASLYDHAGDIYYHCGQKQQALMFWKKAQQLTDDPELAKKLKVKLKRKKP